MELVGINMVISLADLKAPHKTQTTALLSVVKENVIRVLFGK